MSWENLDPERWANALLLLIVGVLGAFGVGQARRKKTDPAPAEMVEVSGAIVSDKAVTRMVQSLDEFSAAATVLKAAIDRDVIAKTAMTEALTHNSKALDRNSETADDMLHGIKDTANHLDRLKDELIRAQSRTYGK